MNEMIIIKNNKPCTTSRLVAEKFDKRHKNIIQSIENLECSDEFRRLNFQLSYYNTVQNKQLPEYIMTRDGFTFLVMGFTGSQASKFKEEYIIAFNKMEQELKSNIPEYGSLDFMQLILDKARQREREMQEVKQDIKRIEAKVTTRPDFFTVAGYATLVGKAVNVRLAATFGRRATKLCKERDINTGEIPDPRFGKVKTYPRDILEEIFNENDRNNGI